MATVSPTPLCNQNSVRVDVRLCGSVPRHELDSMTLSRCGVLASRTLNTNSYLASKHNDANKTDCNSSASSKFSLTSELSTHLMNLQEQPQQAVPTRPAHQEFEAPTWAVPASGEARLEPVCDSTERQMSVDLTDRSVYRIGRSPQSDVQLLHATSSRRHAMLFHHSNGSCYLVDCGSAHGTYVNGVRVSSAPSGGVVVPHRVKRGSIIRFGGPGAPQFMLKSFAFDLEEMRNAPSVTADLTPTAATSAMVKHNTRLNSLGQTAKDSLFLSLSSKRSFDSMETMDCDYSGCLDRCSSPPLSPEPRQMNLVSPEMGQPNKRRRVSFSSEPPKAFYPCLVSPDVSSDEGDDI